MGIPGYPSFGGGGEGGEEGGCGFCAHWCKAHFYLALFAYLLCLSLLNLRPAWVKKSHPRHPHEGPLHLGLDAGRATGLSVTLSSLSLPSSVGYLASFDSRPLLHAHPGGQGTCLSHVDSLFPLPAVLPEPLSQPDPCQAATPSSRPG